jgi:hypothetical protein
MSEEAPPLGVWAFPIVLFFTIAMSFLSYAYSGYGPYAQVLVQSNQSLEKALIENTRDTSAISVVILGSSLTERALLDPKEIEDSISSLTHRKTKVLRVALNYMNMDLATRIDFFDYVSKNPPDYLFIENFGLNLDDNDSASIIPVPIDAALLHIRNQIRNMLGKGAHDNYYTKWYTFDVRPLPDNDFYTDKFDSLTFKSLQTKKCVVRKVMQNGPANSAYNALMQRNVRVIFLDMPQSNKLQTNFLDQASTAELNEVLKFYKTQYRIDYWRFPRVMDDSCFADGAHLNSKGAMQYQKWFVSEIASNK